MFNLDEVEALCNSLSQAFKQSIKRNAIKLPPGAERCSPGEALVFWLADWLMKARLLGPDELRLVIDDLAGDVKTFGDGLAGCNNLGGRILKLPTAKLVFLDRRHVCLDGRPLFVDLKTGAVAEAIDYKPLETIAYNLTGLYLRYSQALKSPNLEPSEDANRA